MSLKRMKEIIWTYLKGSYSEVSDKVGAYNNEIDSKNYVLIQEDLLLSNDFLSTNDFFRIPLTFLAEQGLCMIGT